MYRWFSVLEIPYVWGTITTHQVDTADEQASAYFVEWKVPLEGGEQEADADEEADGNVGSPVVSFATA